jgi:uncharacterized protein YndB with AHSA1/START domain
MPRQRRMDPELDLVLERTVNVPRELVWAAWTEPERVKQWFAPSPWTIPECEIDLRPGGVFRCVMRSPDGKEYPNVGCWLEVLPQDRLVWTDALLPGYRPSPTPLFTAVVELEAHGSETRYTVRALHADPATRKRHEEVGFRSAWGTALDQLARHVLDA